MVTELTRDNPRLLQLEASYAALGVEHSLWARHQIVGVDVRNFRGDGAYLGHGTSEAQYRTMYDYVLSIDRDGYLDKLHEDGAFGVLTFEYPYRGGTKVVSRDLLDSIMEIYFLREALGLSAEAQPFVLDIGAGYGRFAQRLTEAMPGSCVLCLDAVAVSTYLCEFYLGYRQTFGASTVPLTDVADLQYSGLMPKPPTVAVNIHSWSECSQGAIRFWLDRLVAWQVPYLMIVPHDERWVSVEPDGRVGEFRSLIAEYGYRVVVERPKYPAGVDGLYPEVNYHMFQRTV